MADVLVPIGVVFLTLYLFVIGMANSLVYSERNNRRSSFTSKDSYEVLKWAHLWPLLGLYWVPRLLWTQFRPMYGVE